MSTPPRKVFSGWTLTPRTDLANKTVSKGKDVVFMGSGQKVLSSIQDYDTVDKVVLLDKVSKLENEVNFTNPTCVFLWNMIVLLFGTFFFLVFLVLNFVGRNRCRKKQLLFAWYNEVMKSLFCILYMDLVKKWVLFVFICLVGK